MAWKIAKAGVERETFTGKKLTPPVTVKYAGTVLTQGRDYTLAYKNNQNAGTAMVTVNGIGNLVGMKKVAFRILPVKISKCTIMAKDLVYTGETVKLNGLVTFNGWILKQGIHYTTTCNREPKEIGKVTVTVTGKGNFTGSAKVTFNIIPKGTKLTELEGGKGWIKLKWQKQENITGYQIQYSLKSNFTDAEKVNIKKAKIVEKAIRGLKGKTTYYVRIRTYKKVGKKVYYSAWSNAKTVRTEAGKTNNEPDIQDSDATLNVDGTLDLGLLDIPGDLSLPDDVELPGEMELEIAG